MKWFYTIRLFQWSNRIFCFITCPFCNVYLRLLTLPNDSSFSAFFMGLNSDLVIPFIVWIRPYLNEKSDKNVENQLLTRH